MKIWKKNNAVLTMGLVLLVNALVAGCMTIKTTTTARSATEQLLLSTATDHALQKTGLEILSGHRVYLDGSYFDSYDSKYVLGTVRDAISRTGAILVDTASNSEVIVEARSGALAINESETLFGLPSFGIPIPLAGTVQTPEIAFYKSDRQRAYAKFALLAVARESRSHIYSSGPLDGKSYDKHSRALFLSWVRTDVPEAETTEAAAQKDQTWAPQADSGNLPASGH
jgi:hypothetical protein